MIQAVEASSLGRFKRREYVVGSELKNLVTFIFNFCRV